MKKFVVIILISLLLTACNMQANQSENNVSTDENTVEQDSLVEKDVSAKGESALNSAEGNSDDTHSSTSSSKVNEDKTTNDPLSEYSSEEIEYARVWLQLGENQDIDELNATFISAGEPLNPIDETSLNYPETIVQLAGSRLVDGSITYSSNGDGTINVYNVPLRWDGQYPAGEEFYREIIDNTKIEAIDPGDDENVIELIKLLQIH